MYEEEDAETEKDENDLDELLGNPDNDEMRIAKTQKVRLATVGDEGIIMNGFVVAQSKRWIKFRYVEKILLGKEKHVEGIRFIPICNIEYIEII